MRFENQTAVITGGARGIGLAIGQRLTAEGASVWLVDTDKEALSRLQGDFNNQTAVLDITDEESIIAFFEGLGDVSIVVNAAGIVGPTSMKVDEVPLEDFVETCRVNLFGSFLMTKHAIRKMTLNNYGRILLIASIAGKEGNAGMASYSASKAGVIGLVKSAGKEYAETGITINGLAPAVILTDMVASLADEQVKYMTDKIPMRRCGTLDEIAGLAAWIVSPEASFNTGFTFDMTGGRAVY